MLTVFCYHNVEATPCFEAPPGAGVRGLSQQLRLLRHLAQPVELRAGLEALEQGRLPRRAVAVTFDDGYRDNVSVALPILERLGIPASFFLVTDLCSGARTAWWEDVAWAVRARSEHRLDWNSTRYDLGPGSVTASRDLLLADLKKLHRDAREAAVASITEQLAPRGRRPSDLFLDWDDARLLRDRGFSVGSHTCTHPILARERSPVQHTELEQSKAILERELDDAIELLAYPNGEAADVSDMTVDIAQSARYRYACTTIAGANRAGFDAYRVQRVVMDPATGARGVAFAMRRLFARSRNG
jgi:peptidoglycan/xylan/chitin deacetylase (PgdA/CDA1 family)